MDPIRNAICAWMEASRQVREEAQEKAAAMGGRMKIRISDIYMRYKAIKDVDSSILADQIKNMATQKSSVPDKQQLRQADIATADNLSKSQVKNFTRRNSIGPGSFKAELARSNFADTFVRDKQESIKECKQNLMAYAKQCEEISKFCQNAQLSPWQQRKLDLRGLNIYIKIDKLLKDVDLISPEEVGKIRKSVVQLQEEAQELTNQPLKKMKKREESSVSYRRLLISHTKTSIQGYQKSLSDCHQQVDSLKQQLEVINQRECIEQKQYDDISERFKTIVEEIDRKTEKLAPVAQKVIDSKIEESSLDVHWMEDISKSIRIDRAEMSKMEKEIGRLRRDIGQFKNAAYFNAGWLKKKDEVNGYKSDVASIQKQCHAFLELLVGACRRGYISDKSYLPGTSFKNCEETYAEIKELLEDSLSMGSTLAGAGQTITQSMLGFFDNKANTKLKDGYDKAIQEAYQSIDPQKIKKLQQKVANFQPIIRALEREEFDQKISEKTRYLDFLEKRVKQGVSDPKMQQQYLNAIAQGRQSLELVRLNYQPSNDDATWSPMSTDTRNQLIVALSKIDQSVEQQIPLSVRVMQTKAKPVQIQTSPEEIAEKQLSVAQRTYQQAGGSSIDNFKAQVTGKYNDAMEFLERVQNHVADNDTLTQLVEESRKNLEKIQQTSYREIPETYGAVEKAMSDLGKAIRTGQNIEACEQTLQNALENLNPDPDFSEKLNAKLESAQDQFEAILDDLIQQMPAYERGDIEQLRFPEMQKIVE